jgi:hypothetical protein
MNPSVSAANTGVEVRISVMVRNNIVIFFIPIPPHCYITFRVNYRIIKVLYSTVSLKTSSTVNRQGFYGKALSTSQKGGREAGACLPIDLRLA